MEPRRIIFGQPWFDEREEELVLATLRSGWIGQGPLVERFEQELGDYLSANEIVAVNSCTAGLHLTLVALDIGPGDEVITTPFTFVATINAITHTGATPVFVDIDADTLNLSPEAVERAVTERTRAVMPVHFGGRPLDSMRFHDLAVRRDFWIVEDAAHAIGAVSGGFRVGGSSLPRTVTVFSFYPNKNLGTAEGGAIATADTELADRLKCLRLHGLETDAWARYRLGQFRQSLAREAGFKCNWTDLQAAIAIAQLEKLEGFIAAREYFAERYDEFLTSIDGATPIQRPPSSARWRHALHLYQVAIDGGAGRRDDVVGRMQQDGVGAAVHYIGANQHPAYRTEESYPASDWASSALVTLPLHLHLEDRDVERVAETLGRALATSPHS